MVNRRRSADTPPGRYWCFGCSKNFTRADLLRRHKQRRAKLAALPRIARQKSCFECANSKTRCDLQFPSCGTCRDKKKACVYAANSGNPNVRKAKRDLSITPEALENHPNLSPHDAALEQWKRCAGLADPQQSTWRSHHHVDNDILELVQQCQSEGASPMTAQQSFSPPLSNIHGDLTYDVLYNGNNHDHIAYQQRSSLDFTPGYATYSANAKIWPVYPSCLIPTTVSSSSQAINVQHSIPIPMQPGTTTPYTTNRPIAVPQSAFDAPIADVLHTHGDYLDSYAGSHLTGMSYHKSSGILPFS